MNQRPLCISINEDIDLRIVEERHAQDLLALVDKNRAYLRQWLGWVDATNSLEDIRFFAKNGLQQFANNEGFQAGIWYKGQVAGCIGYHPIDWDDRKVEIGYWLAEDMQGKGLMTSACRTLVTYAFDEWGLNKVEIHCAVGNTRSRAIPTRLGFTQEGILREAEWVNDHFVDLVIYGMLAREWQR